LLIFHFV